MAGETGEGMFMPIYRVGQNRTKHFVFILYATTSHSTESQSNVSTILIQLIKKVLKTTTLHCNDRG